MQITYIESNGTAKTFDLPMGASIMEGAIQNDVKGIVAECGGSCMCATCHVYVEEQFLDLLPEMQEEEDEMLEAANAPRQSNSRLGCQVRVTKSMDGLVVRIPEKQ